NNQAANNQVPSDYVQGEAPAGGPADTGFFTPSDSSVPEVPLDDTASPAALARGLLHKRLNHFVLEAFIGGGGMGAVFRGRDQRLDRTVAVKVIPRVGDDADLQRRFRNEAQAVARLDHPNIAKVFDVGRYRGWHYIVFEHVEGTNTRDLVARQGVLSIDDAVYHIQQVAEALQHASQRGITHRDIKPSNVLVRPDGQIKLVDMGLARSQSVEVADDMTASGVTLGTFDYISPEQARDSRDADVRSDIYSLGCTLYYLLTGRPPYPGGTVLQKLMNHGNAPLPHPRQFRDDVSDDLTAILHKMLAKDPARRYQGATDLIADLHHLAIRENLTRSRGLQSVADLRENPWPGIVRTNAPWVATLLLFLGGTMWLRYGESDGGVTLPSPPVTLNTSLAASPDLPDGAPIVAEPPRDATLNSDGSAQPPKRRNRQNQSGPTSDGETNTNTNSTNTNSTSANGTLPAAMSGSDGNQDGADIRDISPASESASNTPANAPGDGASTPSNDSDTASGMTPENASDPMARDRTPPEGPGMSGADDVPSNSPQTPADRDTDSPALIAAIIVDSQATDDEVQATAETSRPVVPGLQVAIDLARQRRQSRVEIACSQLASPAIRLGDGEMQIISTHPGGTRLRLVGGNEYSMVRPAMLECGDAKIRLENLHLQWTCPDDAVDGGCMLSMNAGSLTMRNCAVALENVKRIPNVQAIQIVTKDDNAIAKPMEILFQNVVFRGEMNLVELDVARPLMLDWINGLLIASRHAMRTGGAVNPSLQPDASMSNYADTDP
ncbi:MAG: protein kinase, partial [Planctomycetota bacterium]